MQLLEGKFEGNTEKKESFGKIDHGGSKIVSPKQRYAGNTSRYYGDNEGSLMDSSSSTNKLNDSYGSNGSFPRNQSRRETPEYNTGNTTLLMDDFSSL
jgi:hypothetical protein